MRRVGQVDVVVASVFDNVALVVASACRPVAAIVTNYLTNHRVAVGVKCQCLVSPLRCAWQHHVNAGRVSLRRLQGALQTLRILLRKDGLLVELVVQSIRKEVAARREVGRPRNGPIADDGDLRAGRRNHQSDRACAVGVDGDRVVGGQGQQRVVFVDRDIAGCENLEGERIRPRA